MIQQNYRGDFSIVETFFRNENGVKTQVRVPDRLRIEYFTDHLSEQRFVVERNGATFKNCKLSDDGMSLIAELALSRQSVGCGALYKTIIEILPDPTYPEGIKMIPYPSRTDIVLILGQSDNSDMEISSEALLAGFMYGYSAYQLAVQNGYEGSEEEWLASLKMTKEDLTTEEMDSFLDGTTAVRSATVREIETRLSEDTVKTMIADGTYNPTTLYLCE